MYEDGVRQSIRLFRHEDVPVAVGLVVDHSGSMRRNFPHVIAAARTFVQVSNPGGPDVRRQLQREGDPRPAGRRDALPIAPTSSRTRFRGLRPPE